MNPDFRHTLQFWWKAIKADDRVIGSPPAPSFELVADPTLAVAQIKLLGIPAIELSASFVEELLDDLEDNMKQVCVSLLSGLEFDDSDSATTEFVANALLEQIVSVVTSLQLLRAAVDAVESLISNEIPTLVYCSAGMSRSLAITAVALARNRGQKPEDTLVALASDQPHDVSPILWRDICNAFVDERPESRGTEDEK